MWRVICLNPDCRWTTEDARRRLSEVDRPHRLRSRRRRLNQLTWLLQISIALIVVTAATIVDGRHRTHRVTLDTLDTRVRRQRTLDTAAILQELTSVGRGGSTRRETVVRLDIVVVRRCLTDPLVGGLVGTAVSAAILWFHHRRCSSKKADVITLVVIKNGCRVIVRNFSLMSRTSFASMTIIYSSLGPHCCRVVWASTGIAAACLRHRTSYCTFLLKRCEPHGIPSPRSHSYMVHITVYLTVMSSFSDITNISNFGHSLKTDNCYIP